MSTIGLDLSKLCLHVFLKCFIFVATSIEYQKQMNSCIKPHQHCNNHLRKLHTKVHYRTSRFDRVRPKDILKILSSLETLKKS